MKFGTYYWFTLCAVEELSFSPKSVKYKFFCKVIKVKMPWIRKRELRYSSTIPAIGTSWRRVDSFTRRLISPSTRWTGGRVGSRAGLARCGVEKILLPCWESNLGRLPRSPSLYRLSYPGSINIFRTLHESQSEFHRFSQKRLIVQQIVTSGLHKIQISQKSVPFIWTISLYIEFLNT
jgi:hypothetical protein